MRVPWSVGFSASAWFSVKTRDSTTFFRLPNGKSIKMCFVCFTSYDFFTLFIFLKSFLYSANNLNAFYMQSSYSSFWTLKIEKKKNSIRIHGNERKRIAVWCVKVMWWRYDLFSRFFFIFFNLLCLFYSLCLSICLFLAHFFAPIFVCSSLFPTFLPLIELLCTQTRLKVAFIF